MVRFALCGILMCSLAVQGAADRSPTPRARGAEEADALDALFALTQERAALNTEVMRWFRSGHGEGLYPSDYLSRADHVRARAEALAPPPRIATVHGYVVEAMRLQRAFVAEWFDAVESGTPFSSQLTDEYAYHEGLHRSHRVLLKAYAELSALFPRAPETARRSFQAQLRAMDLR